MSTHPATQDARLRHRLVSTLAVVLLLIRILLPPALSDTGDGTTQAGPAHAHLGLTDHPDEANRHHEIYQHDGGDHGLPRARGTI